MSISIKAARVNAGLRQQDVADALGMSLGQWHKYENNKLVLRTDKAVEFARLVKMPFDGILFFNQTTE